MTVAESFVALVAAAVSSAFVKVALRLFESDTYLAMVYYLFDHSSVPDVAVVIVSVFVVRAVAEQVVIQLVYSD